MGRDEITNSIITNTIEETNPNSKQIDNKWGQKITNEMKFTKHITHQGKR